MSRYELAYERQRYELSILEASAVSGSFAPWLDNAKGYLKVHYAEDGTRLDDATADPTIVLTVNFANPVEVSGGMEYTLGGTAVQGTHYTIPTPSVSPIAVAEGQNFATITIQLLDAGDWFKERSIIVSLAVGSAVVPGQENTEFRLYVRPVDSPPSVEFDSASSSGGAGVHNIGVTLTPASGEQTSLYYALSGTATEGDDYTVPTSGTVTIPAGSTTVNVLVTVLGAASPGETIILTLQHEADDQSDENLWTTTHEWELETADPLYPAEPSNHFSLGGAFVSGTPQDVVDALKGVDIIAQGATSPKQAPDGHELQGIVLSQWAANNWYIRESLENASFCSGPNALQPLTKYTRSSVYVETFLPPDDFRDWEFVRLTLRVRTLDLNHAVMFRRNHTGQDWQGNTVPTVSTPTGTWGVWRLDSPNPIYADIPTGWGVHYGVAVEVVGSQILTRLWFTHEATTDQEYTNAKGDTVVEVIGSDLMNALNRFTYFNTLDGSEAIVGGVANARGKGLLAYWPMLERSASSLTGQPGLFWEKRGNWWEPRGNATIPASGGTTVHTLTVT